MQEPHLPSLDLNLLVALEALLEERSVTRAGGRVGLSQSAMSHLLRRLREVFDDPMFVFSSGRLQPTPRAEALEPKLREAMGHIRSVFERHAFDPATFEGTVRVAAFDYQSFQLTSTLLPKLREAAPGVNLAFVMPTGSARAMLESGSAHLMLNGAEEDAPGLKHAKLFDDDFVVMMRADHPAAAGPLDVNGFIKHDHAFLTVSGEGDGLVDEYLTRKGLRRRIALRLPHFLAAPLIVAETDLLLTLPRLLARRLTRLANCEVRELPFHLAGYSLHLIWHERLDKDPAHTWLRQKISEAASNDSQAST